jgi:acetyl esterase/lipase
LEYGEAPSQFGDLYLPATTNGGPAPLVILLHGGYWRAKYGLDYFGHVAAALAGDGIAAWNLEYRRVGDAGGGWPGTFEDVRTGVAFGRALTRDYPIDASRVVLLGHSAGGHLAFWAIADLATTPEALDGLSVVALAPVTDLTEAWTRGLSDNAVVGLLGGDPDTMPDRYEATCPSRRLPLKVSTCVVHGMADTSVPFDMSEAFVIRARDAGDNVRLVELETDHFEPVDPATAAYGVVRRLVHDLAELA